MGEEVEQLVLRIYRHRRFQHDLDGSIIDSIIAHNHRCASSDNMVNYASEDDVVGMVCLMQYEAMCKVESLATSVLCVIAQQRDLQPLIEITNSGIFSKEGEFSYNKAQNDLVLDLLLKETLRMFNPIELLLPRVATQELCLLDLKIRKGDAVTVSLSSLGYLESIFCRPEVFKLDRFQKCDRNTASNLDSASTTYSGVSRICPGIKIAEHLSKIILCNFVRFFTATKPTNQEYRLTTSRINCVSNPSVDLLLKSTKPSSI